VYDKLEWKTCDGGRDLEGPAFEYCDSLFLEACEGGRFKFDLRAVGDVISGGNGGWFGLEEGDTGDDVSTVGDITAAMMVIRGVNYGL